MRQYHDDSRHSRIQKRGPGLECELLFLALENRTEGSGLAKYYKYKGFYNTI